MGTLARLHPAARRLGRIWTDPEVRACVAAGLVAALLYGITREQGRQEHDQYVRLASSLLSGRVDIVDAAPWLEFVVFEGRSYSHQGVLPAVLLTPFVAVFGPEFDMRAFAVLLGGAVSMAVWSLATRLGLGGWRRIAAWAFPVAGSTIWYEAKAGTTWGVAALASVLFLFLSLNEYFGRRRLPLVGLFVGLAAMCRPPAILALVGLAVAVRSPRAVARLGLGAAGPLAAIAAYDVARFGTVVDISGGLHYEADGYRLQRPPGQFSFAHLPHNLYSWFLLGPGFVERFPYVVPTAMGTALTITSPAVATAFGARRERWLWVAAVSVVVPAALHYANGFTQFGARYLLDAIPFLSALMFIAIRDGRAAVYLPLLGASVLANAYGVYYSSAFGL